MNTPKIRKQPYHYKALIFLSMLYVAVTLAAVTMVNKVVALGFGGYVQGGALLTPLWYALGDIITEVYGYKISRQMLWASFGTHFVFAVLTFTVIHLDSPAFWAGNESYFFVFGNILRIYFSGFLAALISGFANIYVISKLKILMLGRFFWLRSIGASTFSEALYTALIIPMISFGHLSLRQILVIIGSSYALKIIYAVILAAPNTLIAKYLKKLEGVDIYDHNVNFNPFILSIIDSNDKKVVNIAAYRQH